MKHVSLFVSLLTLIIFSSSCKKDHSGCQPQKKPCPDGPRAVGMAVKPQGLQIGTYFFDVSISYTNPGPNNTGRLEFWIGDKQYAQQNPLQHADSANLGISNFTIGLAVDSFTLVTLGYNTLQRCDCDPTVASFHFEPTAPSSPFKKLEIEEQLYYGYML